MIGFRMRTNQSVLAEKPELIIKEMPQIATVAGFQKMSLAQGRETLPPMI